MEDRQNSNIFNDAENDAGVFNMSALAIKTEVPAYFNQWHTFHVGDVLYYDGKMKEFRLAVGENTQKSEAAGVVCEVIDQENFAIAQAGKVETGTRYKYPVGSKLYLSDSRPGMLVSIPPVGAVKEIGMMVADGIIMVDIQRGFIQSTYQQPDPSSEPYTREELEEIIQNIIVH